MLRDTPLELEYVRGVLTGDLGAFGPAAASPMKEKRKQKQFLWNNMIEAGKSTKNVDLPSEVWISSNFYTRVEIQMRGKLLSWMLTGKGACYTW